MAVLADSLETKYIKAIQRVEKIEHSVLAKAFKGELANPDPNDELAAEVLNRILEEKPSLEAPKSPDQNDPPPHCTEPKSFSPLYPTFHKKHKIQHSKSPSFLSFRAFSGS